MYLTQLTLRDWKVYVTASFQFPVPSTGRNIVLIGAPNGYGKTSLFEAIILGLYGQDGMSLIGRSPLLPENTGLTKSYKKFLGTALHQGAIPAGRNSCSVKLTFIDDDNELLEIQRTWHFSDTGEYRPKDEEVHIIKGNERHPVAAPDNLYEAERNDWYRDYIASNLLPFTLAHFFLFDGEQVSKLAERDKSAQVRSGIEGLLGIPTLRRLAEDLRQYATVRIKEFSTVSDETLDRLEREKNALSAEHKQSSASLQTLEAECDQARQKRDNLTRELTSLGAGSQALLQEQMEKRTHCERAIDQDKERLEKLLREDIALALCGRNLRESLKHRLVAEGIRERWKNGKDQGDNNLERFLTSVDDGMKEIDPNLSDGQCQGVLDIARSAWGKLWYPPPENCAEDYRHPWLHETERARVIEQLEGLSQSGASGVITLLRNIDANKTKQHRLQDEITRTEAIAPQADEIRQRLATLNSEIEEKSQKTGVLKNERRALDSQIHQNNADRKKMVSLADQSKPATRRATRAHEVADMIEDIITRAAPSQIGAIAEAMTAAYRSMAHKEDFVERIDINEDCEVQLLNAEGLDIRRNDLSAGEKQIFTQALISAVSSVSNRGFPMVVDTPLGRLDVAHRKGVLKHLARYGHQVVLLSTDTEVVGEYLDEIESHVQKKYLLHFEPVGETGQSTAKAGYFDEEAGT